MAPLDEMGKRLMGQEGVTTESARSSELARLMEAIAKDEKRIRRIKYDVIGMWVLVGVAFAILGVLNPNLLSWGFTAVSVALYITVFAGAVWFVRNHMLGLHRIQAGLLRMEEALNELKPPRE